MAVLRGRLFYFVSKGSFKRQGSPSVKLYSFASPDAADAAQLIARNRNWFG